MMEYRILQDKTNEELVKEYQTTHNEEFFRALLEKNTGLLHIFIRDYSIPSYDVDDLLSESYIALMNAVNRYNLEKGVTFSTFLKVAVYQHLNRLYNTAMRKKRYNGSEDSYEELVELHRDETKGSTCDLLNQIEIEEYLEGLEAKDRYVVTLLLNGYNLSDCAKALNITNATMTWRIKRIRKTYTAYREAV